ncbi:LuxR C-terminal-related transcriptional regulator [Streptomyces sp. NPDC058287]|uniref:LuxR C-terminal-related transcriptional regulator n=1 Tax=unclassified Streptomyces TaxID=2593676 RepID=UPI0036E83E0E
MAANSTGPAGTPRDAPGAAGAGFDILDDVSAAAYGHAAAAGRFDRADIADVLRLSEDEVATAEGVLTRLRLLRPAPGDPRTLVPVGPDAAAADLVGTTERQIRELQDAVTDVRGSLLSLTPAYFEGRRLRNRHEAFDLLEDGGTVQSVINGLSARCRSEFLAVQPGGARPPAVLGRARISALAMLERGVRIRSLYQHTARGDLATRAYVRDVTAAGAEVRTADRVIERILIYDRETVFIADRRKAVRPPAAVVVREPALVAFICSVFEHLWDGASSFEPDTPPGPSLTDDLKRSILRLMAQGHKDETIARKLSMSVRTCRRHISQLTEELAADSRFQAGYNAAMSGLLDDHPTQEGDHREDGHRLP